MRELRPYLKLFSRHWIMLLIGLLLTVCTLLAGLGLLSLSGWFLTACAVAGLSAITKDAFNYMTPAGAVRFFSIVRTACRWGDRVISHDATFRVLTSLRIQFWKKLAPLSLHQLQSWRQGELLNRLVADIDALDNLYLRLITPVLAALLILISLFVVVALFDIHLAFFLCGTLLLLAIAVPLIFYRLGKAPGQSLIVSQSHLRSACTTYLSHQAELLLCGAEEQYRESIVREEEKLFQAQRDMTSLNGLSSALMLALLSLLVCAMLWLAAGGVGSHDKADPLTALMVFFALASFEALQPLAGAFQYLSSTLTAARRLNQIMETTPAIQFGTDEKTAQSGELSIQSLSFCYPHQPVNVINELSLQLRPGEKVAILGPTGCGKSTLLGLLTREWNPAQGAIFLDQRPLAEFSDEALRASMSVVSQRVHVFSATLADNLRLAKPSATDADLQEVLLKVELDHLLEGANLKESLKLWLGEGGRALSGGEQRRLSLARALLHDAPLLLLDEVTEGLDPATEQRIMHLILQHSKDKSVLMITHRLTGLSQMDRIALLENGQFRLTGSHTELLAADLYYQSLFQHLQDE
ncbi:heme ABC transporter ATP-binding protein/permease CydC [Tolumonas lignilytica]|uniref:heme ABC transporter ATP-binding protein/permease CydC n=1 Tax=Tolumonas lignilytica TaxID=1283284 RepID=UPI000466E004|nr:cysteine/glutathione ABC transporter ATP-binding protein/permease CydC [Tolumonas lignilytica]